MSRERFLSLEKLPVLVSDLLAAGTAVFAPTAREGGAEYRKLTDAAQLMAVSPLPGLPLKALFFPPSEPLFYWRQEGGGITLKPVATTFEPTVVLGSHPCDAAAIEVLDKVMGWDYKDELWFGRRAATTIVSVACTAPDRDCFCDVVGLGPAATKGSDVMLVPVDGGFHVDVLTEKGAAFVAAHEQHFGAEGRPQDAARCCEAATALLIHQGKIDAGGVRAWVASHFEDPYWATLGLRCHGCGACASVCPTCHCFDIVDEPDGLLEGTRRRNWDTCQSGKFTVHASGHNPRHDQNSRFRQRVSHKFRIYPERFGEYLCTGCGRCTRACPAGQDISEILGEIVQQATSNV
jgi:ferredoxin